jgi:hypothetical protein
MKEFSYLNIIFFIILIVGNSLTHEKITGLLISLPQFLLIFYLLLTNNLRKAFFWHLVFTITCLAIPFSQITNPDDVQFGLFNYSKLKLLGPIGVYHVVLLIFFLKSITLKVSLPRNSLFYSLYRVLIYLGASGILLGLIGLIFLDYYLDYFILYSSYIVTLFLTIFVLIRMPFQSFLEQNFKMILEVIIAAPLAAIVVFLLGFNAEYGGEEISIILEVVYYSITLIFSYYHLKSYWLPMLSFLATGFLLMDGGMGGKGIIFMVILLILFITTAFKKLNAGFNVKLRKRILLLSLLPIILIAIIKISSYFQNTEAGLFLYKVDSVLLLVNVFQGFNGINLIPESPRVRIIEIVSIFHELFRNPIYFLFGKGYGAYYYDYLNLFSGLEMKNAYKPIELVSKKYAGVHDSFSSIPLANGMIGLILIFRLVLKYTKKIKYNFMAFAAIPWLGFTFYYNVQFGIVAVLLLFSAEKYLNYGND